MTDKTLSELLTHYQGEQQKITELRESITGAEQERARLSGDTKLDPATIVAKKRKAGETIEDSNATIEIIQARLEPIAEEIKAAMIVEAEAWDKQVDAAELERQRRFEAYLESDAFKNSLPPELKALIWYGGKSSAASKVERLFGSVDKEEAKAAADQMGITLDFPQPSDELLDASELFNVWQANDRLKNNNRKQW